MIHKYKLFAQNIVLDINSGSVHVVSDSVFDVLENPFNFSSDIKENIIEKYGQAVIDEVVSEINLLIKDSLLYSEDIYKKYRDEKTKNPPVKALCLHIAHDCDLRCRYCFAGTGAFAGTRGVMDIETAKKAIDFVINNSQSRKNIEIDFFGGEPTLNFEVVKQTVDYALKEAEKRNKNFRFTITTNGLSLSDEQIEYINKYMSNVVLSCDGRKEINDKNRKTIDNDGSYDTIIGKFQKIADNRNQTDYYIRGTFTRDNLDFKNDVLHLADLGFRQISVEPVALGENHPLSIRKEDLPRIFSEYEELGEEIIKRELSNAENKFNFFHFMIDLEAGPCALKRISGCGAGCEYLAVTPSGDIFPCHQFADQAEFKMGNVFFDDEINPENSLREEFRTRDIYTIENCQDCFAKFYCSGGCAASSRKFQGNLLKNYEIGCELQKKRTEIAIAIAAATVPTA